jgi:hypothetical protein
MNQPITENGQLFVFVLCSTLRMKEAHTFALPVTRPERPRIEIGIHNFGSMNKVESAFPARIREEMHQNVAHPRELVTESCLFKLSICGLE